MGSRAATRRIDHGQRGHSYELDGRRVDGVTTILSKALAKNLTGWAAREVAKYAADHVQMLQDMQPDEIVDLLKGAPFRDRDRAANRGTEVHDLARRLGAGEEVEVPEELIGHVDAYLKFLKDWEPRNEVTEAPCFNRKWKYAGTFDLLAEIPGLGERCLVDIKTNRSGVWPEVSLQLVAYGHADFYKDPKSGAETPMPPIDWYGGLWLRDDGYSLYPFAITEAEWKQFQMLRHSANWLDTRWDLVKLPELWMD